MAELFILLGLFVLNGLFSMCEIALISASRGRLEKMRDDGSRGAAIAVKLLDKPEDFRPEEGKRYGLLSYRGDPKAGYVDLHEWERVEELSPGSGKLMEAAVRLFHVMRVLDEEGLDAIVAEPVSETGLGVAIMDRLRRASAPR